MPNPIIDKDEYYREKFLTPLRECMKYLPQFGGKSEDGVSLKDFQSLYGADPLYHWVGLDSPAMYAAHKASGGMTSVYRQLGIGCERLVREIIKDSLNISSEGIAWGYDVLNEKGKTARITLDAHIAISDIEDVERRKKFSAWLLNAAASVYVDPLRSKNLIGAVIEVRQGYKSADSKRQNADLRSAIRASNSNLLPIVMVISTQINSTVQRRYQSSGLRILIGSVSGDSTISTFAFFREVIGYDLAAFFTRNQLALKTEVQGIVGSLLTA